MSKQATNIKIYIGFVIFVFAIVQTTATAQDSGYSMMPIGTVITMEGKELDTGREYEQYTKFSGTVILPETEANMYRLMELSGRDDETMIVRITSKGDVLLYNRGKEGYMFLNGPVSTSWEMEYEGHPLMGKIVEDGITIELLNGDVYSNVVKWELYSMDNPMEPELLETHWLSPEVGFEVQITQEDPPFIEWLVDITRK